MLSLFKRNKPTSEELEQLGLFFANHPLKVILIMLFVTVFTCITFLLIFNGCPHR